MEHIRSSSLIPWSWSTFKYASEQWKKRIFGDLSFIGNVDKCHKSTTSSLEKWERDTKNFRRSLSEQQRSEMPDTNAFVWSGECECELFFLWDSPPT